MSNRWLPWAALALLLGLLTVGCQLAPSSELGSGSAAPERPAASLAVDPTDGSLLKAAGGLFRSVDQGRSWVRLELPGAQHPEQVRQVATTPAAPSSLYAAGPGGVLRSDDRGRTWRTISAGLPSQAVAAFAVHSSRPDTIYAWITGQGVFRTEDGGTRWEKMDDGPPAPVVVLAHSTLEGSMNTGWLYAATPDGFYLSMDCF